MMNNYLSGLGDWFNKLSPEAKKAMIAGGFNAAGSFMESRAQAGETKAQREWQTGENTLTRQFQRDGALAGVEQDALGLDRQGATSVLGQTRMGEIPSTYGNLAMRRALFESLAPGTNFGNVGGFQAPAEFAGNMPTFGGPSLDGAKAMAQKYLSEDALKADLTRRLSAEARVDPKGQTFDMTSIYGSGAAGNMGQIQGVKDSTNSFITGTQDRTRQALQGALGGQPPVNGGVTTNQGAGQPFTVAKKEKKNTPWWKKVIKYAAIAAPFVAAPFTGGASLALIGAGAGAAGAWASGGGAKEMALSGALGAAGTKGMGKGATNALTGAGAGNAFSTALGQQSQYQLGRVPNVRFR